MANRPANFSLVLLLIAGIGSILLSCLGFVAFEWEGAGFESIARLLAWLLPLLSFPGFLLYFLFARAAVILFWSFSAGTYWGFLSMNLQSNLPGRPTNPFLIAGGTLIGNPYVYLFFICASCVSLAARMDRLSKGAVTADHSESTQG